MFGFELLFWVMHTFPISLGAMATLFAGYCGSEAVVRLSWGRHLSAAVASGTLGVAIYAGILSAFAFFAESRAWIFVVILVASVSGSFTAYQLAKAVSVKLK